MKTSKIKTVRNIGRIRTPLVTLSVAVCLATLMGCGNSSLEADLKAAEQGDAVAQCNLGVRYVNGEGVPEDAAEAVKWFVATCRYSFQTIGLDKGIPEGLRGGGGQGQPAVLWGIDPHEYVRRADPWPLNPVQMYSPSTPATLSMTGCRSGVVVYRPA